MRSFSISAQFFKGQIFIYQLFIPQILKESVEFPESCCSAKFLCFIFFISNR
ncbi:hypothetical protein HMPREF0742_01890 [Rothia aeria F0184]|uniref:Uncharacterized protein n=1 Tax=Rothia aeria F0184 TaxID=888019 RepID=U7V1P5_9MICC|nr:hypothetical protein HMPREF0742_01890 [Rothia aeria F0184]